VSHASQEVYLSGAGSLPIGPCPRCEREVLTYLVDDAGADADGGEAYACVHCDGPIRGIVWIDDTELAALGYELTDARSGCATGCANGGCAIKEGMPFLSSRG